MIAEQPGLPVFRKDLVGVMDVFRAFAALHGVSEGEATEYLSHEFIRREFPVYVMIMSGLPRPIEDFNESVDLWTEFFNSHWWDQALLEKLTLRQIQPGIVFDECRWDFSDFGMRRSDVLSAIPDLDLDSLPHTTPDIPPYLNRKHARYSAKLAAAVAAWLAVTDAKGRHPKQAIIGWLEKNAPEFSLIDSDGKPNATGIEEIAKVVNWRPTGGAPKTPNSEE